MLKICSNFTLSMCRVPRNKQKIHKTIRYKMLLCKRIPFEHLESTIQDIHKMTIIQKSVYTYYFIFEQSFFVLNPRLLVMLPLLRLLFSACSFPDSFCYKSLPFVTQEAAVLIIYLVDVHIFVAVTTVYWISFDRCMYVRLCANVFFPFFVHFSVHCSHFFPVTLLSSPSFTHLIFLYSFHSFAWFSLNHFGDCYYNEHCNETVNLQNI